MSLRLPRWGYPAILGGVVLLLLGARMVLSRMARPHLWFTYAAAPPESIGYDQLSSRPGWAKTTLTMPDGVALAGLISKPAQPDAPWVLFFPGNDANQLQAGQRLLEKVRADHGWGLAVYASRGFPPSGGTPGADVFAADASRVLSALFTEHGVTPSRLHLVAFSLGGYAALSAFDVAAKQKQKPASLSLLASIARIAMVRPDFWGRFGTGDVYDVQPLLAEVPAPVLVVQGGADEAFVGTSQGKQLAAGLGERGRYVERPGVGHTALLDDDGALAAVRGLIETHATASTNSP